MNKKKILITILSFMIIILVILIIYVAINKKNNNNAEDTLKDNIIRTYINKKKKDIVLSEKKDIDTYNDKIITELNNTFNYQNENITKKIYIDENNDLYIDDSKIEIDAKFKTLYSKEIVTIDSKYLFLISIDNKLYALNLESLVLSPMTLAHGVTNFVNIYYDSDSDELLNNYAFVLQDDGNIYDIFSGLRYDESIKLLFNKILIYNDNTISNMNGFMFETEEGKYHKIKYAFKYQDKEFGDAIMIITDENRYVYSYDKEYFMNTYEGESSIINLEYNQNNNILKIYLDNGNMIEYKATCSKYFCPSEELDNSNTN